MQVAGTSRPLWSFLGALAVAAFVLNWLWEMLQMPAYAEMAGRSWRETALPCARASLGDVALTLAVYGLGALAAGRLRWGAEGTWNVYAAAALLGGAFATALEHIFLAAGRWSYAERMLVVPGLGVGLWPLLQLMVLVPASPSPPPAGGSPGLAAQASRAGARLPPAGEAGRTAEAADREREESR